MSTEPGGEDALARLQRLYREHAGIETVSGLNPLHFNAYRDTPFTYSGATATPSTFSLTIPQRNTAIPFHATFKVWKMIIR